MARKLKKKTDESAIEKEVNPSEEITKMEETIKNLESKLEQMSKKKSSLPNINEEDESNEDFNADIDSDSLDNVDKSDPLLDGYRDSDMDKDDGSSSSSNARMINKDENPLSNKTFEIDPEQKEEYLIQIYLLYPITSGEIMVQIESYLNVYQVAENRKLIQKCEADIMKTNEPQPLQISVTTKEEPNKEKTITFSKVIGIVHSLPMITSITTI